MGRFYILQLSTHKASTTQTTYGERRNGRDGNCVEVTSWYHQVLTMGNRGRCAQSAHCKKGKQAFLFTATLNFRSNRHLKTGWYKMYTRERLLPRADHTHPYLIQKVLIIRCRAEQMTKNILTKVYTKYVNYDSLSLHFNLNQMIECR